MSRKSQLVKFKTITNGDMSSSITGAVTNIEWQDNIGIQLNFTGAPSGTFQVQISADYEKINNTVTNAGNWISLVLSPVPTAAGAADNIYVDITQISAPWIRVVYTRTSGTGILNAFIVGKQV